MTYTVRIIDKLLRFDTTHENVTVNLLPFVKTPNAPYEIQKISVGDGHTITIRTDSTTSDFLLPGGVNVIVLDDTTNSVLIRIPADGHSPAFCNLGGGTSGGGGGGGSDVIGPVTNVTGAGEVGTRYVNDPGGPLQLTIGFVPVCPTPQPVTYLISDDNGVTWVWIGSQRMTAAGQQLKVERDAPSVSGPWKVAVCAGNVGGDPSPIPDASLDVLYAGIFRSAPFTVAGLAAPPASTGITATIGACVNQPVADGLTQFGIIPGVVYTDPTVPSTAWFVRITVQSLDAGAHALLPEQPHGGTQITGGSHTEAALPVTYIPGLAFIRYKFYLANTNSQGAGDFSNPATNTLQMVSYNGGALANHYDVPVTVPPFTLPTGDAFNVVSVSASEVGPKYTDSNARLHTTVGVVPVISIDYSSPRTVTIWLDEGDGNILWQDQYSLTGPGQVVRIGDSTLGTEGAPNAGGVYVPANTAHGTWTVWCAPGKIEKGINPSAYAHSTFTVTPLGPCRPDGTTAASFVANPVTIDPVDYSIYDPGVWFWEYYELTWTPPNVTRDPNYWKTLITVQKGATIGGVWTPAPDSEGANEDPHLNFLGRTHAQFEQISGAASDQASVMRKFGANPATFKIPPAKNKDQSVNPYREFRFLIYNISRLGMDSSGSGGAGTYTLQTTCFGGTDHAILIPQPRNDTLDLSAANPATIALPMTGGNGLPLTIPPYDPATDTGGIGGGYLGKQAVHAINMAANAITAENSALAGGAVVDGNVHDVGINKVTYGISVFAGDVVLSRGISLPSIVLQNTGIFIYGQADAANGYTGLTTKPYVAIQSGAIGLFQGGATSTPGGSLFLDAVNSDITIYQQNGDLTKPYLKVSVNGITAVHGVNSFLVTSNGLAFVDAGNKNRLDMSSGGVKISTVTTADPAKSNAVVITSTDLQVQRAGIARVTLNTSGVTVSDGGAASVVVTSSQIQITSTGAAQLTVTAASMQFLQASNSLTISNGGINISSIAGTLVADSTGITLSTTSGGKTVMDSTGTRSISGTQCVRNAGGIGVQLWASWNETAQVGDQTKPFIGLEASTGNVYVGSSAHLLTLSGGQLTFAITGQSPTTVITNTSIATGQAGIVPFALTCDFFPTAGTLAGYRKETVNGTTYKVPLYNL